MEAKSISVTQKAAAKLRTIMQQEGKMDWVVKFADMRAGCGGFEYILDLTSDLHSQDLIFHSHGITIGVPTASINRLVGAHIDFEYSHTNDRLDGLLKMGFTVLNPNEKAPCPCGCNKGHEFDEDIHGH